MLKQLEALLEVTKITIVGREVLCAGPFTIVKITASNGKTAVGVSRTSWKDKYDENLGLSIAKGRAERALLEKIKNKPIRHQYMG